MTAITDHDLERFSLQGERVAVIGYGSQGRAQALNLRDSGTEIVLGLRGSGSSWDRAKDEGFEVRSVGDAVRSASFVAMLTPDMTQPALFEQEVGPHLNTNACLLFAHGFSVHYDRLALPQDLDVVLVAPKGPGDLVRKEYERGRGVPCLYAVYQDETGRAESRALGYAQAIGGARGGLIGTTFAEETETDLFGEQAVLCGGVKELVKAGFETLVEAGYSPEVAYFECMHELKLIVDLFYEGGLSKMHQFVSETAKFGALTQGPKVVDLHTRQRMAEILAGVQSGQFARKWVAEHANGLPLYSKLLGEDRDHQIEQVGRGLRSRMAWLNAPAEGQGHG
jgi:ketol-acid reductoisomerase